jgi:hypothetical protein
MAGRGMDVLLRTVLICSVWQGLASAATYDLNVSWLRRNPDGMADRSVIGINGQWPIPVLNFTMGENVIVNLHNQVRQPICCCKCDTDEISARQSKHQSALSRAVPEWHQCHGWASWRYSV